MLAFVIAQCIYLCVIAFHFRGCVQTGYNTDPNEEDSRVPMATWNTCSYTISCWGKSGPHGELLLCSVGPNDSMTLPHTQREHAA